MITNTNKISKKAPLMTILKNMQLQTTIIISGSEILKGGFWPANFNLDPVFSDLLGTRYSPSIYCKLRKTYGTDAINESLRNVNKNLHGKLQEKMFHQLCQLITAYTLFILHDHTETRRL